MLDPLDNELKKRGHQFARYADDFTILVKSQRAGERVLRSISHYLQSRLKLVVNTTKSHVVKTTESKFLGFTFRAGRIQWHPKTLLKFKQQVRRLTNRNCQGELNLFKRGTTWVGAYQCNTNSLRSANIYEAGLIICLRRPLFWWDR